MLRILQKKSFPTFSRLISTKIQDRATIEGTKNFFTNSNIPYLHKFKNSGLVTNPIILGPLEISLKENDFEEIRNITAHSIVEKKINSVFVYRHNQSIINQELFKSNLRSNENLNSVNLDSMSDEELNSYYENELNNLSKIESNNYEKFTQIENKYKDLKLSDLKLDDVLRDDEDVYFIPAFSSILKEHKIKRSEIITIASLGAPASSFELKRRLFEAKILSGLSHIDVIILEVNDSSISSPFLKSSIATLNNICKVGKSQFFGIKLDILPYTLHSPVTLDDMSLGSSLVPSLIEDQILKKNKNYRLVSSKNCEGNFFDMNNLSSSFEINESNLEEYFTNFKEEVIHDKETPEIIEEISTEIIKDLETLKFCDLIIYPISPTTAFPSTYPMLDPDDLPLEMLKESSHEDVRTHTRASWQPLLAQGSFSESEYYNKVEKMQSFRHEYEKNNKSSMKIEDLTNVTTVPLISNQLNPDFMVNFKDSMDDLCPELKSSLSLEDKVLRTVFSAGIDIAIVDPYQSPLLKKSSLKKEDLLASSATSNIFGRLFLPKLSKNEIFI